MAPKTPSSSSRRSTPRISAPMAPVSGFTSRCRVFIIPPSEAGPPSYVYLLRRPLRKRAYHGYAPDPPRSMSTGGIDMPGSQTGKEGAVTAAVEAFRKAMVAGDRSALEKLTADELTYGHSSARLEDKAQFVESLADGKS